MPARMSVNVRRAAATAAALVGLMLVGALIAVSPAEASVVPLDRGITAAGLSPAEASVVPLDRGKTAASLLAMRVPPRRPAAAVVTPASKVLAMASSLRGRPYVYGASGPAAFDCSGFTRYVFLHALGRSLVHNAALQYADSIKLARSAVRPGDLVFFTYGTWVYHVGIYAGAGRIWDAPYPGQSVRLEKIATSSWVAGRVR